jgi:hypothetical protein
MAREEDKREKRATKCGKAGASTRVVGRISHFKTVPLLKVMQIKHRRGVSGIFSLEGAPVLEFGKCARVFVREVSAFSTG